MTDHLDVREALELAAAEPGGLDRLEAGDTEVAAAVIAHLAGCPSCLEELARLRRAETLLRPILAAELDPSLRERTLALVRETGVPRDAGGTRTVRASTPGAPPGPASLPRRGQVRLGWVASLAAVLVVGLLAGALVAGRSAPGGNADPGVALDRVAAETAALVAAGDSRQVVLVDATGTALGVLVLSPSAGRMVVTATGLRPPTDGSEYRCWVEVDGSRRALGAMWWAGDVAWWAGDVAIPADLPAGVGYGVSLAEGGSSAPGTMVLSGSL